MSNKSDDNRGGQEFVGLGGRVEELKEDPADGRPQIITTKEEIDAIDKALGVFGDHGLTPEQIEASREKIEMNSKGIKVTRADGTTFTT